MKIWNQWKCLQDFLLLILTPTRSCRETCCEIMNINSKTRKYPNCAPTTVRRLLKKGQFFITLEEEERTRWNEECMSRVHVTSKRTSIPSERVDCRKHEIGQVLDVKVCLHQRRYGIEIMVESLLRVRTVCWVGIAKGIDKYVNRSVRNHFSWKRWAQSYREICCESKATTNAYCDTVSYFYSCSWKKLDRYEPREIPSRLFYSVRSHDQITATWSINSSRRWWSSTIWLTIFLKNQGKVRWYVDDLSGKGRRTQEKVSILLEP